mgnify:FL=1
MSLIYEILKDLSTSTLKYKGSRVNFFGIPKFKKYSRNSLSGVLSYLQKNGLVEPINEKLRVTLKGQEYIKKKAASLQQFYYNFNKVAPKDLIVMFDIPETKKAEREWLRWHLKKFDYAMIQRSVWVGPSPLPKEFIEYLKKIDIKDSLKIFKLAKGYNLKK